MAGRVRAEHSRREIFLQGSRLTVSRWGPSALWAPGPASQLLDRAGSSFPAVDQTPNKDPPPQAGRCLKVNFAKRKRVQVHRVLTKHRFVHLRLEMKPLPPSWPARPRPPFDTEQFALLLQLCKDSLERAIFAQESSANQIKVTSSWSAASSNSHLEGNRRASWLSE